ncbi:hypothetical protein MJT46_016443 [Ovis ammon polii x Ovis aries]|nr:hypothetical protein MJT46_016443 [Ovis ammon polii x Ovis aries]
MTTEAAKESLVRICSRGLLSNGSRTRKAVCLPSPACGCVSRTAQATPGVGHPPCAVLRIITSTAHCFQSTSVLNTMAYFIAYNYGKIEELKKNDTRCTIDDRVTRVAWLNRSTILYAGNDKWSIDPRVIILVNTPTQYSIMIQNVDVYDEGPYTCSVQTDNHPKTSRVHLIVQGKQTSPQPPMTQPSSTKGRGLLSVSYSNVLEPRIALRRKNACDLASHVDPYLKTLTCNHKPSSEPLITKFYRKHSVRATIPLYSTFSCFGFSSSEVDLSTFHVPCAVRSSRDTLPPQIMNISSDVTVNEGSSVTLLCLAIGRPEPTVTWRHLSVKEGQGFVSEDEYLEISDIKRDQSGEYECSALNDVAAPDVRKVKITVNYPPYISKAKNTGVSVGQKGILSCEASAVPMAEFQWFKEDTRLATGLDGMRIENKGHMSTLTFFNVSEKDYGNYTCVATNKLGITNASITLYEATQTGRVTSSMPAQSSLSDRPLCSAPGPLSGLEGQQKDKKDSASESDWDAEEWHQKPAGLCP